MHITLIRSGGFIPVTKKAETDVSWTDAELQALLTKIEADDEPGNRRDATSYELETNAGTCSIDIDKVPAQYAGVFNELKNNLKIVK